MYRNLLEIVREYMGGLSEYLHLVAIGVGVLAIAIVLQFLPPWRRAVRAAREGRGWRAVLLALANALMALAVVAALVAALGAGLLHQSREFQIRHGNVTAANQSAVETNWGKPHEQRELAVSHYVTKEQTVLVFPDGREVVEEEGEVAELPKGENAPTRLKRKVRTGVPQNSIVSAQVDVNVQMNYRKMGSAYYTAYEDTWDFDYLVKNRSDQETEAEYRFPMPADQGNYSDFIIRVNGQDWRENIVRSDTNQLWKLKMTPGQEARIQVHYASRGTGFIRYTPAYMARREAYKVTMRIHPDPQRGKQAFAWEEDMAPPIGCMTPQVIADSPAPGQPMTLEWDLKSVATTLGMGIKLPAIAQPGAYAVRLLHEAPWGIVLLAGSLAATWLLLGREVNLTALAVLVVAYTIFYTLTAYLSTVLTSFTACFALGALATLAVAALYLWVGWGRNFAAHQTMALMAVFAVYYPLAAVTEDSTAVMTQILYWALVAYAAILAVAALWRRGRGEPSAESVATS